RASTPVSARSGSKSRDGAGGAFDDDDDDAFDDDVTAPRLTAMISLALLFDKTTTPVPACPGRDRGTMTAPLVLTASSSAERASAFPKHASTRQRSDARNNAAISVAAVAARASSTAHAATISGSRPTTTASFGGCVEGARPASSSGVRLAAFIASLLVREK